MTDTTCYTIDHAVTGAQDARSFCLPDAATLSMQGAVWLPGLFDLHAKLSTRGVGLGKSIKAAHAAAQQGGVRGMLVLSTPSLCFDNAAQLDSFQDAITLHGNAEISSLPAGAISKGLQGEQQAPYNTLQERGVRLLSDAEFVPSNQLMLYRVMKYLAETDLILALRGDVPSITDKCCIHPSTTSYQLGLHGSPACAEEIGIESILRLAADAGASVHIQTVSTAESVEIIRRAKAAGQAVTAEVALHHLIYTHENVGDYDTTFKTLPPLRDASDNAALLAGVKDGTIDCIVTDHTPCTPFDKMQDFPSAPQGMIGLDNFLPMLYTELVATGKLSWQELIRATSTNPHRIATGSEEELAPIVFLPDSEQIITADSLPSGTLNSPVLGQSLRGTALFPHS